MAEYRVPASRTRHFFFASQFALPTFTLNLINQNGNALRLID